MTLRVGGREEIEGLLVGVPGSTGRCSHLEGETWAGHWGSVGKGLFQKVPTGEAQTRIPPLTDGAGPPAVTVGKDT